MRLGDLDALKEYVKTKLYKPYVEESAMFWVYLIEAIDNAPTIIIDWEKSYAYKDCMDRIKALEEENKTLIQLLKRPKGEWKHIVEEDNDVECPFCGFQEDGIYYNFCPSCGAKMEIKKND